MVNLRLCAVLGAVELSPDDLGYTFAPISMEHVYDWYGFAARHFDGLAGSTGTSGALAVVLAPVWCPAQYEVHR